jgi:hypothetical protein
MSIEEKDSDRRANERLDLSLQISLCGKDGKTINISNTGVYFEVITDDIEAFSPGTTIPIQITANTSTSGLGEKKIKLNGNGTIIRNSIKNVAHHGNQLCIALEFKNKLDISDDLT